jgi:hypothetical protein
VLDGSEPSRSSETIVNIAKIALGNLSHFEHYRGGIDHTKFSEEFSLVKIHLPRQSGHSTAALQLLYEYPRSLCVVPNHQSKENMMRMLQEYTQDTMVLRRVEESICIVMPNPYKDAYVQRRPPEICTREFLIFEQSKDLTENAKMKAREKWAAKIILELQ